MGSAALASPVPATLHVDVRGAGPDLVLLHGWGFDHRVWGAFADALARHFRLHLVDLPGHGRSHALPFESLDQVATLIAGRVPANATVCGWSLGGLLAMRLAHHTPRLVGRLVLISASPCFAQADDWAIGVPRPVLAQFRAAMARDSASARRGFATLVAHGSASAKAQARWLATLCDTTPVADPASLSRALEVLHAANLRADAGTITAPALVLHGERDAVVSAEASRWLADHLGHEAGAHHATIHWLDSAGHAPFLDAPQALAQAIVDWHG